MKERIACLFLAIVLVISIFGTREAVLNFAKASDNIKSIEGECDKKTAEKVDEINFVEETIPVKTEIDDMALQIIEATELEIVSEYYDEYFGENITFSSEYVSSDEVMNYLLYTPSTVEEDKKTPLIVWLHGSGEVGVGKDTFYERGFPNVLENWMLNGFTSYVICPHLSGKWNTGRWNSETTKSNLKSLLDRFVAEHNIDTERVIVVGHSLGGQGAQYMAHELPEYFTKCVVLSGYNSGIDISEIAIPMLGYVGTKRAGEDGNSVNYMQRHFADIFGDDSLIFVETSHGGLPKAAFNIDEDCDLNSDLIEWMLLNNY